MNEEQDLPSHLQALSEQLRVVLRRMDPQSLSDAQAVDAVKLFTVIESLGAAGKTTMARRIERSKAWHGTSHRSAAHYVASKTGMAVGQAVATLETARRLEHLPRHSGGVRLRGAHRDQGPGGGHSLTGRPGLRG